MKHDLLIQWENRPCYVIQKQDQEKPQRRKAMFHRWIQEMNVIPPSIMVGGHSGGQVGHAMGIVEFEDGSVQEVYPHQIIFADGGGFGETAFFPPPENP